MKEKKLFVDAFGLNEFGLIDFPVKISNVRVSRILHGDERGCGYCFPHGWETSNSTIANGQRSWKRFRKNQMEKPELIRLFF